jgi:hypothetical protein
MLNLKKTAVAVLAFGSSAVFAGTMGPVCTPGNVTVPCPSTGWAFAGQALYLKPSFSGYGYYGATVGTTSETYNSTPNNWGWGFKLEGAYYFNTGNDLDLNWYHWDHTTNSTATSITFLAPLNLGLNTITSVSASNEPKWDAVNLEFGQLAHFGEFKNIRFHGGVEWARIETNVNASGTIVSPASISSNLKYDGFGPRIGVDYAYNWGNGLAMYANGASALLVGTQKFNDTFVSSDIFGAATPTFTRSGSATFIVPELEAKLGLTYTYAMAQGDLSLDVGWMWVNYFNALHDATIDGLGDTHSTNFAVQGPFIGLKWVGNVV